MDEGLAVLGSITLLAIFFIAGVLFDHSYLSKFNSWEELKNDFFK